MYLRRLQVLWPSSFCGFRVQGLFGSNQRMNKSAIGFRVWNFWYFPKPETHIRYYG